jgi:uncharacterized protein (DUF1697 family)
MPRYAAFLRGVGPTTLRMPDLKRSFEAAGFTDVRTLLSSGNVVFTAPPGGSLERKAEAAMSKELGRTFLTIVRSIEDLRAILASDPYAGAKLPRGAKRVVTFLREKPVSKVTVPVQRDGASIVRVSGLEAFSAYVRTPRGPAFMVLIEKTFGKDVTTRTWETVQKVASAGASVRG